MEPEARLLCGPAHRELQGGAAGAGGGTSWRKVLSRHSELLFHYSSWQEISLLLPNPGPLSRNAPPPLKLPSQHPPLSWKLLSKKVVKMIKCEQIFSSFSTLIKNGLSIQGKLEMN